MDNKSFQDKVIEAAIASGGCPPLLQVETRTTTLNCFVQDMPDDLTTEEKADAFRSVGERLGHQGFGDITSLHFASEAWMSSYPKGTDINEVPRPAKDPNRVEVIVLSALHIETMTCSVSALKMERDEDGKLVSLTPIESATNIQAPPPILSSFIEGYTEGQLNEENGD